MYSCAFELTTHAPAHLEIGGPLLARADAIEGGPLEALHIGADGNLTGDYRIQILFALVLGKIVQIFHAALIFGGDDVVDVTRRSTQHAGASGEEYENQNGQSTRRHLDDDGCERR